MMLDRQLEDMANHTIAEQEACQREMQREAEYERERANYAGFSEEAVNSLAGRISDWFGGQGGSDVEPGTIEVNSIVRYHGAPDSEYVVYWSADRKGGGMMSCRDTMEFGLDGDKQRVVDFKVQS